MSAGDGEVDDSSFFDLFQSIRLSSGVGDPSSLFFIFVLRFGDLSRLEPCRTSGKCCCACRGGGGRRLRGYRCNICLRLLAGGGGGVGNFGFGGVFGAAL